MTKFFVTLVAALFLVATFVPTASADTWAFGGVGFNTQLLRDVENNTYDLENDFAFSGGLATSIGDKWLALTIYDYHENDVVSSDQAIFINELLASVGYRLFVTGGVEFYLLGGFEITDGNVDDYGTFLSGATGGLVTFGISEGVAGFAGAQTTISNSYNDAKVRAGLAINLDKIFGSTVQ